MDIIEQAEHLQMKAARFHDESKSALKEAAELQQQAIAILLSERNAIDQRLAQLGHGQEKAPAQKRRGRPARVNDSPAQPDSSLEVLR
jgi:hypothetical protein